MTIYMMMKTVSNIDCSKQTISFRSPSSFSGEPIPIVSICKDCGNIRFFWIVNYDIVSNSEELFQGIMKHVLSGSSSSSYSIQPRSGISDIAMSGVYYDYSNIYHPLLCNYCGSDKSCYICDLKNDGNISRAGLLSKCKGCKYRFLCGTTKQEPQVYDF